MPDETFRHLLLLGGEDGTMNTLRFLKAEQTKAEITNEQLTYIRNMYQSIANGFAWKIKWLSDKSNISSVLKIQYLQEYQKELADEIGKINQKIGNNIKNGMEQVAQAVVDNEVDRALSYGMFGISGKFSNIPNDVVETIISGQLYQSDWTLSKAIWGTSEQIKKDCQNIVARGIVMNKSVYDVAKDLEAYVNPSVAKDYQWSKDYPGSSKVVDYNASRLARTMMSHAYQESFERATEHDPFIQGYKWNTGHNTSVCPYCMAMSTEDKFGLGPGIYPKDNVPLDHPNGQCFLTIVQNKSSEQVADDIANWYNGTGDVEMNSKLDKFAESLGYKPTSSKITPQSLVDKYGKSSGKQFNGWYNKLSTEDKAIAKGLKDKEGLTWQGWYTKYVKNGQANSAVAKASNVERKIKFDGNKWLEKAKLPTEKQMLAAEDAQFAKFTQAQIDAIRLYSGSSYTQMNSYLRYIGAGKTKEQAIKLSGIKPKQLKAIDKIQQVLDGVGLDKDYVLRRGTDLGDLAGLIGGDFNKVYQELEETVYMKNSLEDGVKILNEKYSGMVGEMHGFTSTSSMYGRGFDGDVEMIFYAPKGTAASSIMRISQYGTSEGETLLNAGTRVKVHKIELSDGHMCSKIRIFCEILK